MVCPPPQIGAIAAIELVIHRVEKDAAPIRRTDHDRRTLHRQLFELIRRRDFGLVLDDREDSIREGEIDDLHRDRARRVVGDHRIADGHARVELDQNTRRIAGIGDPSLHVDTQR